MRLFNRVAILSYELIKALENTMFSRAFCYIARVRKDLKKSIF